MPMNAEQLGAAMYQAVKAVENGEGQASVKARYVALARAIIDHVKTNATIAMLSTTSIPADGPAHIHNPKTVRTTGVIS